MSTSPNSPISPIKVSQLKTISDWFAVGFGSGLAPKAPGTFGTLAALPLVFALSFAPIWLQITLITIGFIFGVYCCDRLAEKLGVHDHSGIVWDEFIGFAIACIAIPQHWFFFLLAFILFRFFDIVKPWPIKLLDSKVDGGFGIMVDDVVAGLFALFLIHIAFLTV